MSIGRVFLFVFIIILSFAGGVWLAISQINSVTVRDERAGAVIDDYWITDLDIGSTNATGLLRARISRKGLFALNRTEAIYFNRSVDDEGAALHARCRYEIAGGPHPADWWSITLYGTDDFLARNSDDAGSINGSDPRFSDANWRVVIADRPEADRPWLSTNSVDTFDLTLRLYGPDLDTVMAPEYTGFPSVTRLDCDEDKR